MILTMLESTGAIFCTSLLQIIGIGVIVAPLIGFLESIAIAKAFGELSMCRLSNSY